MADTATNEGAPAAPQMPQMNVIGQFIKDMSFENIAAQKGMQADVQPDINVQVGINANKRDTDKQFDVTMKLNIDAKTKGDTPQQIFVLEMDYTGIFHIDNVPENQLHPFLLIECPRMIFPFVRRIVADVTRDGGFPPMNLETIDFVGLYRNEITRRAQAEAAAATKS